MSSKCRQWDDDRTVEVSGPFYDYIYTDPSLTYEDTIFGDSSKCSETKAYNYDGGSIDNSKCFEKFDPGHGQPSR